MPDSYHIPFGRLHNGWLLLYHPHSQYGYLRLIDDRRTEQRLERAEIGNRKRTARYVVRHQLVDARLGSQAVYRNGKPAQVQPVGIMHNGNNQVAVVLRYGYSHIDMFLEQDIVTFYGDVHLRIGNQRFGSRFGNGRHIGQLHPFTFKESLLVFFAPLHQFRHIHFHQGSDMRRSVFGHHHVVGNHPTDTIHLLHLDTLCNRGSRYR